MSESTPGGHSSCYFHPKVSSVSSTSTTAHLPILCRRRRRGYRAATTSFAGRSSRATGIFRAGKYPSKSTERSLVKVAQLLDLFGFLSVLLRGATLAFEALTLGGIVFVLVIARGIPITGAIPSVLRWLRLASILLVISSLSVVALNSAILLSTTGLSVADLFRAEFWI